MEKEIRAQLTETACAELLSYGVWNRKTYIKRAVSRYILRRQDAPRDDIFWPTGLLAAGLWSVRTRETEQKQKIWTALEEYYGRWMHRGAKIIWLDDLLAGETLLAMYEECCLGKRPEQDKCAAEYRRGLDQLAEFARKHPTDETGSFPYRPLGAQQENSYIFVDTIGLACPFLYRYGEKFDRPEYQELAVCQIANYLAYGMDEQSGLPYHGYDLKDGCKYGIIGWGRATGWLLRGMTGCMGSAYGREKLEPFYQGIVKRVVEYQRPDGYFPWQLAAKDGPKDSSATAMIGAALQEGIRMGVEPLEESVQALDGCRRALSASIREGRIYDCSAECEGFARYPQRYGAYPWSLGPGLEIL